jgi:hypothetical protein
MLAEVRLITSVQIFFGHIAPMPFICQPHVNDHHLGKVAAVKTAMELWDDLETTYKSKRNVRKILLRREINALKLGFGEPISMYVARAEDLYKNLTSAGSEMKLRKIWRLPTWQVCQMIMEL